MRRGLSIAEILKNREQTKKLQEKGLEIQKINIERMKVCLQSFRENLEAFAIKYRENINKDPALRQYFNELCTKIGADPLVSNRNFWAEFLGIGDFYYKLAVQIIQICILKRSTNGGLIEVNEVLRYLRKKPQFNQQHLSEDDIERAISKVKVLSGGFELLLIGSRKLIQSIPYELSNDHKSVLLISQEKYYVTLSLIRERLLWDDLRSEHIINSMLQEGLVWIDQVEGQEPRYWFTSLFISDYKNKEHHTV